MKTCKKCYIEQPLENFKIGYECKSCEIIRKKEWYENNKKRISDDAKIKYQNNRELYLAKSKERDKDKKKLSDKKYYENNKTKILNKNSEYVKKNFIKTKEYKKEWAKVNKEKLKSNRKNYYNQNKTLLNQKSKERMKLDPIFALSVQMRKNILKAFRKRNYEKSSSTKKILGCTYEEFKIYLESKFEPWMNWDNRGLYNGELNHGWDIDHIIPLSSAKTVEDMIKLNHFTNLQPLCSFINRNVKKDN
jgi:hypothetical protein